MTGELDSRDLKEKPWRQQQAQERKAWQALRRIWQKPPAKRKGLEQKSQ